MEQQKSRLKLLVDVAIGLNNEMHKALVKFLKRHGGFIRTDNRRDKDIMYAYVVDTDTAHEIRECAILAVALLGENQVAILPDYTYNKTNLEGMTDEEVLASEDWILLMGGECIINATAYQLCESIEEYV